MFTGVLRHRSRADHSGATTHSPEDVLARLLRGRSLHPHRFVPECEIGPFIVDHVCREQALVIQLSRSCEDDEARRGFLESLGYRVLIVNGRELVRRPEAILVVIHELLRDGAPSR